MTDTILQDTKIQNTADLLSFLQTQSEQRKDWFGFIQQKLTAVSLAHKIAERHADKMTPDEVVNYAKEVTELLYHKVAKPNAWRF